MATEQEGTRKLRAILSADVKGYSLLMTNDEASTVKTLKEYRNIMSEIISDHSGNVVDMPGDNIMAEFSSVVNAVKSSVAIQETLKLKNNALPNDKRLEFRIGINIGDVIQDGDSLYGEAVNIAARIEGLADPGGICMSRGAYDHIKNKLKLGYEFIGEHAVKNIKDPVRVYKVLIAPEDAGKVKGESSKPSTRKWILSAIITATIILSIMGYQIYQKLTAPEFEPAFVENMIHPLPEKPSIAVLPFDNLSGEKEQEYFSDGLTEQIISTLSKIRNLFVIARNSTFTYKGKPVKVQKIAENLGVRYILEGSVQRTADRIRITAQLIDATTGHHIWSERYDREQKDIFDIQDDITMAITKALEVEVIEGEQARIWQKDQTSNLVAYEKFLQGHKYFSTSTREGTARARELFNEAISLDSEYTAAYTYLGWTYWSDVRAGWADSKVESIKKAYACAQKSLKLNPDYPYTHVLLGLLNTLQGQYEKAIEKIQYALTIEPNSADYLAFLGGVLGLAGRWSEGIGYSQKSIRMSPSPNAFYNYILGRAYFMTGQYDEAIESFKQASHLESDIFVYRAFLSACYSSLGRQTEAAAEADEVLRLNPQFTLESYAKTLPYKNKSDIDRYISALRRAGLPEKPPLPLPDKPSIAVLPFDNMSGDPEQEYFSDGLTDELICDLAKIKNILVISRNSTFTYKGKFTKVQEIAKDLNVRYILEGSVQKIGDQVRIRAQLIDGKSDHHMWSESYDGMLDNIFELQDKITGKIVSALAIELTTGERYRLAEKGTNSIVAHDAYLKGMAYLRLWSPDALAKAIKFFKKAVELDPNYGQAYTALAESYLYNNVGGSKYWKKTGTNWQESHLFRRHYINLAMKNPVPKTFSLFAYSEVRIRHYDEAIKYAEKAVTLAPNDADVLYSAGLALFWAGKPREALRYLKKSNRLEPLNRSAAFMVCPYFSLKQYDKALDSYENSIINVRDLMDILPFVAASYGHLGQKKEARATLDKWIGNMPGRPNVDFLYGIYAFRNFEEFEHLMKGLASAGRDGSIKTTIRVSEKYKLTGPEIKELMFGKTEAFYDPIWFSEVSVHRKKDGEAFYKVGDTIKKGTSWIKDDMICNKFEGWANECDDCADIYRNPLGEYAFKNDFLKVTDYEIIPFSIKQ